MDDGLKIALSGIATTFVVFLFYLYVRTRDRFEKWKKDRAVFFKVAGKETTDLTPVDVMDIRGHEEFGYNPYYYKRSEIDNTILQNIKARKNTLILGRPLAGKTRAVLESLKSLGSDYFIYIPNLADIRPIDIKLPDGMNALKRCILFLDDIDQFAAKQNFSLLLNTYVKERITIIATCRNGGEYDILRNRLEKKLEVFGQPIEIDDLPEEEAKTVAQEVEKDVAGNFDGTIGSLFVSLDAMKDRFNKCSDDEKDILESTKRLYDADVYSGHKIFSLDDIKQICHALDDIKWEKRKWKRLLESLERKSFLKILDKDKIQIEEIYLQKNIPGSFDAPYRLLETSEVFKDNYLALFAIANHAFNIGDISLQKAEYEKTAIEIYKQCLVLRPAKDHLEDYAAIQNNLGNALGALAEIENKAENSQKAISAYQEALKVRALIDFPMQYASTQTNLGIVFSTLAEVESKAENCRKAIEAFQEALKVRTLDDFPMQYAGTQNNLGNAYRMLGEVESKTENSRKAIEAYREALKVRTLDDFPMQYITTLNNLGTAYGTLAQVEDKAENCRKAIIAYQESLKVRTLDDFPMQYAMTQNNLGTAYGTLAQVENKVENCRKAIDAYREALKVYTLENFPMQYANTQNNLGATFGTLGQVENKTENRRSAFTAYQEALQVYTVDDFPIQYAITQNNLGIVRRYLGVDNE